MFHALTKNTIELQKMTPTTPIVSMQQYKNTNDKTRNKNFTFKIKMHELNINFMQFMLGVDNYIIIIKDLNNKKP
jgi:hypothetical protein